MHVARVSAVWALGRLGLIVPIRIESHYLPDALAAVPT